MVQRTSAFDPVGTPSLTMASATTFATSYPRKSEPVGFVNEDDGCLVRSNHDIILVTERKWKKLTFILSTTFVICIVCLAT
eukprot:11083317-Ditylum_brightwellii.AAC.1